LHYQTDFIKPGLTSLVQNMQVFFVRQHDQSL